MAIGWNSGSFPLSHVTLGGENLYVPNDYIMVLKTPSEVQETAKSLPDISEEQFRDDYFRIDPNDYGFPVNEEDYGYTWSWFQGVGNIYYRAAKENRYVLFTASQ